MKPLMNSCKNYLGLLHLTDFMTTTRPVIKMYFENLI
jgi:hypothetical protein